MTGHWRNLVTGLILLIGAFYVIGAVGLVIGAL